MAWLFTPSPVPLPPLLLFAFEPAPVVVLLTCVADVILLVVGAPVYALIERNSKYALS